MNTGSPAMRLPRSCREMSPVAAHSAALWSLVHGFSVLPLEGRFDGLLQSLPATETADTLLAEVLAVAKVGG